MTCTPAAVPDDVVAERVEQQRERAVEMEAVPAAVTAEDPRRRFVRVDGRRAGRAGSPAPRTRSARRAPRGARARPSRWGDRDARRVGGRGTRLGPRGKLRTRRDFRDLVGFRTLDDFPDAPRRRVRLPAAPARPGRRRREGSCRDGQRAGGADAPGRPQLQRVRRRPRLGGPDLRAARRHPAHAGVGREALHVGGHAAAAGASGRLETTVLSEVEPDAAGVVDGDLYLRGGGDPTFDVLDSNRLAQQVADAGITEVTGRVIGDESRVRRPPRRAVVGVPAHLGGRPALGADVQPRSHRAARALLAEPAGELRRDVLHQAAPPPRRRRRARLAPRSHAERTPSRWARGARSRSPTCCG